MGLKNKITKKVKNTVDDLRYGTPKEKAKAVLDITSTALDIATIATGTGAVVKTAKTAGKLAKCGKGAKMVTKFTKNAQKANIAKAATKAAAYQAGKNLSKKTKDYLDDDEDE